MKNYKDGLVFYDAAFDKTKQFDIPLYYVNLHSFFKEIQTYITEDDPNLRNQFLLKKEDLL